MNENVVARRDRDGTLRVKVSKNIDDITCEVQTLEAHSDSIRATHTFSNVRVCPVILEYDRTGLSMWLCFDRQDLCATSRKWQRTRRGNPTLEPCLVPSSTASTIQRAAGGLVYVFSGAMVD